MLFWVFLGSICWFEQLWQLWPLNCDTWVENYEVHNLFGPNLGDYMLSKWHSALECNVGNVCNLVLGFYCIQVCAKHAAHWCPSILPLPEPPECVSSKTNTPCHREPRPHTLPSLYPSWIVTPGEDLLISNIQSPTRDQTRTKRP